jgi:transposase
MLDGAIGMAISITREDGTPADLRFAASRTRDGASARRLLALALVLEGSSRTEAAESCGMDRQTLRDWVHRYNAEGVAGLSDRQRSGRPPYLTAAQEAEVARIVEAGPDLATHGVVRWRCVDLQKVIADRFGVALAERTVAKLLKKLRFVRLSPRPYHPKKDAAAQEAFKKTSPGA